MKTYVREAAAIAALSMAVALAACGGGDGGSADRAEDALKIGLLLPDATTARWEKDDRPLLEKKIRELCAECMVEHANGKGDVATQQQQVDSMIIRGVDVMVLAAVDAKALQPAVRKADEANVRVVAYDRLAEGPISGYVSFDGEEVGRLQGEGLLDALGDKADGSRIVMMNGDPTDPNAAAFKKGALSVLEDRVRIAKMYDNPGWRSEHAHTNMSGAISTLGADNIDGVYSANDGLAAGVISALKANKINPLPPVTGQDAELGGVQRIVTGEQYMSVYKPFEPQAAAGAEMAVALARGENLDGIAEHTTVNSPTAQAVPAVLLTPVSLTVDNIKETVVKDGLYTIDQICTPKFRSACDKAGLTG
ncbi:sugar ABC transporter substrate-binding protein [Streptomyces himalayensis]|uniref:Substrate-binding domain-containing protein n=1 Tax=Streptomyces himalayensis subsp. himalayensis TaxID=2756131 RepID=A0A7W0I722_9ACTN|nr:substrate-binding domain-containing protein [Streptomyces himalayensis]MBA2944747.1 substrate-binding domain-containing protein [Streptomyces himalayensis subsp. himalayensis]